MSTAEYGGGKNSFTDETACKQKQISHTEMLIYVVVFVQYIILIPDNTTR